jgi:enterochelin esterase-like enzyme
MRHPEMFGCVGAFSPFVAKPIREFFARNEHMSYRFYINHGIFDHLPAIHESVGAILPILRSGRYPLVYQEYAEGHSYGLWRAHVDDALLTFFPMGGEK